MLKVDGLKKLYVSGEEQVQAVQDVSFEIGKGEVFTLLGPSGCGKSTTLRCIAGLEVPEEGEIQLGDRPVFSSSKQISVSPDKRDIGMVFQSYAIWPHMTVFDNVAFPLRHGPYRLSKQEVLQRVMQVLELVQLNGLAHRPSPMLSGGQQQRVALARALVYEPTLLLLDEPLSNLDAKLRVEMRSELKALIKRLEVTTLYVTHDQEEALVLSDRIAVMQHGRILQEGSPRDIYLNPMDFQVAGFVGRTNLFPATVEDLQPDGTAIVTADIGKLMSNSAARFGKGDKVWIAIRPEDVVIHGKSDNEVPNRFPAQVSDMLFIGKSIQCELQVGPKRVFAELNGRTLLTVGQNVHVELPKDRVILLQRSDDDEITKLT